ENAPLGNLDSEPLLEQRADRLAQAVGDDRELVRDELVQPQGVAVLRRRLSRAGGIAFRHRSFAAVQSPIRSMPAAGSGSALNGFRRMTKRVQNRAKAHVIPSMMATLR